MDPSSVRRRRNVWRAGRRQRLDAGAASLAIGSYRYESTTTGRLRHDEVTTCHRAVLRNKKPDVDRCRARLNNRARPGDYVILPATDFNKGTASETAPPTPTSQMSRTCFPLRNNFCECVDGIKMKIFFLFLVLVSSVTYTMLVLNFASPCLTICNY